MSYIREWFDTIPIFSYRFSTVVLLDIRLINLTIPSSPSKGLYSRYVVLSSIKICVFVNLKISVVNVTFLKYDGSLSGLF